jgi:Tfp pilus assembly protein PilF
MRVRRQEVSAVGRRRTAARKLVLEGRVTMTVPRPVDPVDPIDALVERARRLWTRGEMHRALTLLREACHLDEWRARTWTIFAARLAEAGQRDAAAEAFNRARWLRRREGDGARVAVIERLAARAAA